MTAWLCGTDVQYTALEAMPAAQAARQGDRAPGKQGQQPWFKRILTAVASTGKWGSLDRVVNNAAAFR